MCGRYASFIPADLLHQLFRTVNTTPNPQPTWNMAPTRDAPVVRLHPETRQRHLDLLHWGLVPHWARDPKATRKPINARAETLATSPMFRDALARRRCLVPADAFCEWQATGAGMPPREAALGDRAGGRHTAGFRRAVGRLAWRRRRGAANVHYRHDRGQRDAAAAARADAGDSGGGRMAALAGRNTGAGGRPAASVRGRPACAAGRDGGQQRTERSGGTVGAGGGVMRIWLASNASAKRRSSFGDHAPCADDAHQRCPAARPGTLPATLALTASGGLYAFLEKRRMISIG